MVVNNSGRFAGESLLMNLQSIKEALHLEQLRDQDLIGSGFWLVAIIVVVIALRSAKVLIKAFLFVVAMGCAAAAVWSHLHK